MPIRFSCPKRSSSHLLATTLLLMTLACSPSNSPVQPTARPSAPGVSASTLPNSPKVESEKVSESEFKTNAVALKAVASTSEKEGYLDLSRFSLPDNVDIAQVSVVEASLDGRKIDVDLISLGTDTEGGIVFFFSEDLLDKHLLDQADDVAVSMHSAEVFAEKTDALRSEVLQNYQDQLQEEVDEQVPTPAFLSAAVRGESLSRQQVATLKKDAGKLAKENVFIDRHFYCVLSVANQEFSVQQSAPQYLINKFALPGDQVGRLAQARKAQSQDVLQLPVVAEKITPKDPGFFHPLAGLEEADKIIEIEEIEEVLELELGAELAPKGVSFDEFELPLGLEDLQRLEQNKPQLARRPLKEAQGDNREDLATALKRARERAKMLEADFERLGRRPIPDARLFASGQVRPPRFQAVPLRRQAGAFQIPPHLLPPLPRTDGTNPALPDGNCPPPPPTPDGTPIPAPTPLPDGSCPAAPEGSTQLPPPDSSPLPPPSESSSPLPPPPEGNTSPPPPEGSATPPPPGSSPPPPGSSPLPPPPGSSPPPPPPGG